MDNQWNTISRYLEDKAPEMVELQRMLTAVPAICPGNGGEGEWEKAAELVCYLEKCGFPPPERFDSPDPRARNGLRPNLLYHVPGRSHERKLWIISHLDVVPPGDLTLWDSDPYTLRQEGDRIYGRGVEDNQQGMVASVFAARALIDCNITPDIDLSLLFVADEETGSAYGLDYVISHHAIIDDNDLVIIPDAGNSTGTMIEIAEKSILWLRFTTIGKQTHASRPDGGINAFMAGTRLIMALEGYFSKFTRKNNLFDPPVSTFQPTKKEANVENINTIPGRDVFHFDCRILPEEELDQILQGIDGVCKDIENQCNVTIRVEPVQKTRAAAPTPPDAPVVVRLRDAIETVYNVIAKPIGIGGGTVANFLRQKGIPVAVWSRHEMAAHQPNEYCLISNMVGDAKVFARIALSLAAKDR